MYDELLQEFQISFQRILTMLWTRDMAFDSQIGDGAKSGFKFCIKNGSV